MPLFSDFSHRLLYWYEDYKRDLPWRNTKDPYKIWVSEIILQQTRVQQGISYYERFIDRFPDVKSLAKADQQDVLNLWQGLGYYSRARNMHSAARMITDDHQGIFPNTYQEIKNLKGIGEYTASAISSFAFDLAYPVIDGNVNRVICRLFGIKSALELSETKKRIKEDLSSIFDKKKPASFNQAIMEFGALQCTPQSPDCEHCPFNSKCVAFNTGQVKEIPLKKKEIRKRDRFFNYAVLRSGKKFVMKKRTQKDIWQDMYDFPLQENDSKKGELDLKKIGLVNEENMPYEKRGKSDWRSHVLSHQNIYARFHEIDVDLSEIELPANWVITDVDKIEEFPLPKLIESYINGG